MKSIDDLVVKVQALLLLIIVPARWRLRLLLAAPFKVLADSFRFIRNKCTLKVGLGMTQMEVVGFWDQAAEVIGWG